MSKHTPGRLRIAGRETRGLPHTLVAANTLLFRVYSEAFGDVEQEGANARRLVACWNACEGITDPENVVPRLLALNERAPDLEHQAATLRVQRDELLAALEGLTGDIQALIGESDGVAGLHMNGDIAPWGELEAGGRFERLTHLPTAHAAIAKVKGGAA